MTVPGPAVGARAILDAATALFAESGFDGASVAAIAEKAGVCKANVFHHFPSKEDLYFAVLEAVTAAHADYTEDLYRAPGSSADKVHKLLEFQIRDMLDNPSAARLLLRQVSEVGHARVHQLSQTIFQRNFTAVVNIFDQGRQRGEFHSSVDPGAAAMLLCGATQCFFNCREVLREFRASTDLEKPEAYVRRVAALILKGVLRVGGPPPSV
jgi:TetR/AcrR family transcriptional regulator